MTWLVNCDFGGCCPVALVEGGLYQAMSYPKVLVHQIEEKERSSKGGFLEDQVSLLKEELRGKDKELQKTKAEIERLKRELLQMREREEHGNGSWSKVTELRDD